MKILQIEIARFVFCLFQVEWTWSVTNYLTFKICFSVGGGEKGRRMWESHERRKTLVAMCVAFVKTSAQGVNLQPPTRYRRCPSKTLHSSLKPKKKIVDEISTHVLYRRVCVTVIHMRAEGHDDKSNPMFFFYTFKLLEGFST